MSLLQWLTTGSFNGIYLEQMKEPALSRPFLHFFSSATIQSKPIHHGYDLSHPLSCEQLADVARQAGIIDEHDGKPLADKILRAARQKISASMPSTTSPMSPAKSIPCCIAAARLCAQPIGSALHWM